MNGFINCSTKDGVYLWIPIRDIRDVMKKDSPEGCAITLENGKIFHVAESSSFVFQKIGEHYVLRSLRVDYEKAEHAS